MAKAPKAHPYISSSGPIIQAIEHLRRSFPASVSADTLKKLGIASKNESYLINILRFLSVINEEGKRTDRATRAFNLHDDAEFQKAFSEMVKDSYVDLFTLHGDAAWKLDPNALITFFRQADQSSGIVGTRQANTFRTLAALAGHGEPATTRPRGKSSRAETADKNKTSTQRQKKTKDGETRSEAISMKVDELGKSALGLTVRVEINLPADATQEAYDKIFQSLRKNLIDGR